MSIVVADDKAREREWLVELLARELSDQGPIHAAADGNEALKLVLTHKPRLVFLDIEMPGMSGIKAAEQIVKRQPLTGIIIISHHSDEIWVRELWKVIPSDGAFGYLLKESSDKQIIEAARAVLSGDCAIHPHVQRIVRRSQTGTFSLSDGEFEVLSFLSIGLTDRAIARHLCITEKAVQARLKGLYGKLCILPKDCGDNDEVNRRCRAMNIAVRRGLINKSELEELENFFPAY